MSVLASRPPVARRLLGAVPVVAVLVVAVVLPFSVSDYWLSTLAFVLIAAIAAIGLDVLTGRTGQISLGVAFFLGVGAYVGGYLGGNHHLTAAIWIPAAGAVAGVLGAIVGPAALRLRGLYLGIVSIGLIYIGQYVFNTWTSFSGGPGGRSIPDPTFGSVNFANGVHVGGYYVNRNGCYYYLALVLVVLAMLFVRNLRRSSLGRSMIAVRDRELAAAVLGVDVAGTKVRAFVISSVLAGISGALYGAFLSFVNPGTWDLLLSIQYVVMIVVGGMASTWGPPLGALLVIGLPSLLQDVSSSLPFIQNGSNNAPLSPSDASNILFGVILVVFLIVEPRGLVGIGHRITYAVAKRRGRLATAESAPPAPDAVTAPSGKGPPPLADAPSSPAQTR